MWKVEHERFEDEKEMTQRRYYISSLAPEAKVLLCAVRRHWHWHWHWHIENKLHWVLDVAFREDESRIREACGGKFGAGTTPGAESAETGADQFSGHQEPRAPRRVE